MKLSDRMTDVFYSHYFQRFHYVFPNCYGGDTCEMDIMGVRPSRYVDEVEIKISKSDFKADFNKRVLVDKPAGTFSFPESSVEDQLKHDMLKAGRLTANRFWFFVPEDLAPEIAAPSYAGLIVLTGTGLREITPAPLLHKRKLELDDIHRLTKNMMFRYWKQRTERNRQLIKEAKQNG